MEAVNFVRQFQALLLLGGIIVLNLSCALGLEEDAERITIRRDGHVISRTHQTPLTPGHGGFIFPHGGISTSSVPTPTRTKGAQEEDLSTGADFDGVPGSGESSLEESDYSGEVEGDDESIVASGDGASIEEDENPLSDLKHRNNTHSEDNVIHDEEESKNAAVVLAKPRDLKASATGYGGGYGHGGGGQ